MTAAKRQQEGAEIIGTNTNKGEVIVTDGVKTAEETKSPRKVKVEELSAGQASDIRVYGVATDPTTGEQITLAK
jgi:hypothetical protein